VAAGSAQTSLCSVFFLSILTLPFVLTAKASRAPYFFFFPPFSAPPFLPSNALVLLSYGSHPCHPACRLTTCPSNPPLLRGIVFVCIFVPFFVLYFPPSLKTCPFVCISPLRCWQADEQCSPGKFLPSIPTESFPPRVGPFM